MLGQDNDKDKTRAERIKEAKAERIKEARAERIATAKAEKIATAEAKRIAAAKNSPEAKNNNKKQTVKKTNTQTHEKKPAFVSLGVNIPNDLAQYFKKGYSKYIVSVPEQTSFEIKTKIKNFLNDNDLYDKVIQNSTPGSLGFYGGLTYDDYVNEYISVFSPDSINFSRDDKRKMFQKSLGLPDDWVFNKDEFNKAFNKTYPQNEYRQLHNSESNFGYDHLDAIRNNYKELDKIEQKDNNLVKKEKNDSLNNYEGDQRAVNDTVKKPTGWWLQDKVNFLGALTDKVNRYEPMQAKVDLNTQDYSLLDPTRQLAANQEQMARFLSQVENTVDGNVGLAAALAASGKGFENAANVIGQTENKNVTIANQAKANKTTVDNQEKMFNEQARLKYIEDLATLNQNYDDAKKAKKWNTINAFNNGVENMFKKKWDERVIFPNVQIDSNTGSVSISKGADITDNFGYYNNMNKHSDYAKTYAEEMTNLYKEKYDEELEKTGDEGIANKFAKNFVDYYMKGQGLKYK